MARKLIDLEIQYGINNSVGRQQLKDYSTLERNKNKFPFAWRYANEIINASTLTAGKITDPEVWFQSLTTVCAGALDGVWEGNGSAWTLGNRTNSRNKILLPNGWFDVNYHIPISQGGLIGRGNNIATLNAGTNLSNGNNTSYLSADHPRWVGHPTDRTVCRSSNWGSSSYFESAHIDGFRINGNSAGWVNSSFTQSGIEIRTAGEGFNMANDIGIYVHDCNNHGVDMFGSGPGKVGNISCFDNNGAGFMHRNGNSLGGLVMEMLSMDNNGYGYVNDAAGTAWIGYIKCENGLSLTRGKPHKQMPAVYAKGLIGIHIGMITYSLGSSMFIPAPIILEHTTGSLSQVEIDKFMMVIPGGSSVDKLILCGRSNRAYKPDNFAPYKYYKINWQCDNSGVSSVTVNNDNVTNVTWGGNDRLGIVESSFSEVNYTNATPVWNPTGGIGNPTASWSFGTWGSYGPCIDGFRTRLRTATASYPGVIPSGAFPDPLTSETEACVPLTDAVVTVLPNFTNVSINGTMAVTWVGVRRIKFKNLKILEPRGLNNQRLATLSSGDDYGIRITFEGQVKMSDGQICITSPEIFKANTLYPDAEIIFPSAQNLNFFLSKAADGTSLRFSASEVRVLSNY